MDIAPRIQPRVTKTILALAWIAGWIHVIGFAPEDDSSILEFIMAIMRSDTNVVDPMVSAVFNLLGIWPLIMVAVLVQDDQGRLKAWPFAFSSMVLGNSALYVYLFFRRDQAGYVAPRTRLVRFAESKILAAILWAATIALVFQGLAYGSLAVYAETWRVNYLVNVMTVDFFLFSLAFACLLGDDMRRRENSNGLFWVYALLPVVGAATYLVARKPLPRRNHASPQDASPLDSRGTGLQERS